MQSTKITVKVFKPLLLDFDRQIESLFIKRDAFLDHTIKGELHHLAADLEGKRQTSKAKRYIAGQLKRLGTWPVNIVVDKSTADELNSIVEKANIVRDSFVNRLIMLLRSSHPLLKFLELPEFITRSQFDSYVEPMPTSPLKAIESVHSDPLYYLRVACHERYSSGLYTLELPPQFHAFACYMDDSSVPGTEAYVKMQEESEAMIKELEMLEGAAFQKAGATQEDKS